MPVTTFLHDSELNRPTSDSEIDELLAEVRKTTGRNYQIVETCWTERFGFLGLRTRPASRMRVYLEVGGVGPWQELQCTKNPDTVRAYLLGMLNGHEDALRLVGRDKA